MDEIEDLLEIVKSQPQAALTLLTKGVTSKWSYLLRTVNEVDHYSNHWSRLSDRSSFPTSLVEAS